MPDPEKMRRLDEIGYAIPPSCALCAFATFPHGREWGACSRYVYDHAKHGRRTLSVMRAGVCRSGFRLAEEHRARLDLSGFGRLLAPAMSAASGTRAVRCCCCGGPVVVVVVLRDDSVSCDPTRDGSYHGSWMEAHHAHETSPRGPVRHVICEGCEAKLVEATPAGEEQR